MGEGPLGFNRLPVVENEAAKCASSLLSSISTSTPLRLHVTLSFIGNMLRGNAAARGTTKRVSSSLRARSKKTQSPRR